MVSKLSQKEKLVLGKFLEELFEVLKVLDHGVGVLEIPVPVDFYEGDATKISSSLFKVLDKLDDEKEQEKQRKRAEREANGGKKRKFKKEEDDEVKKENEEENNDHQVEEEEKVETTTTIMARIEATEYSTVYEIYHDIKVACTIKLLGLKKSTQDYQYVDNFYKVSTELLLREIQRLSLRVKELESAEEKNFTSYSLLEDTLSKNFNMISTSMTSPTGETVSVVVGNKLPLFSSLTTKSELDDREPILPESFSLIKVAPQINSIEAPTFAQSNFSSTTWTNGYRYQHPSLPQVDLLQQYFHPNWYNLPVGQWLKMSDSLDADYAPKIDESRAVLSNEWRGLLWLEEIGFKKLSNLKEEMTTKDDEDEDMDILPKERESTETPAPETKEGEHATETNGGAIALAPTSTPTPALDDGTTETKNNETSNGDNAGEVIESVKKEESVINLENILLWAPDHEIEKDEMDAVKEKKTQAYISKLLMDLQTMRQERYKSAPVVNPQAPIRLPKPSRNEMKTFYKVKRLLTSLMSSKNVNPGELDLKLSSKLPVLQTTYGGTLPAPATQSAINRVDSRNTTTSKYKKKK